MTFEGYPTGASWQRTDTWTVRALSCYDLITSAVMSTQRVLPPPRAERRGRFTLVARSGPKVPGIQLCCSLSCATLPSLSDQSRQSAPTTYHRLRASIGYMLYGWAEGGHSNNHGVRGEVGGARPGRLSTARHWPTYELRAHVGHLDGSGAPVAVSHARGREGQLLVRGRAALAGI